MARQATHSQREPGTGVGWASVPGALSSSEGENFVVIEGRAWPVLEDMTSDELQLIRQVSGIRRRQKIVRAIEGGDPNACVAYVLSVLRRVDPDASLEDARRAVGGN